MRAIVEVVGSEALTVQEIEDRVGEVIQSVEQAPIDAYVAALIDELEVLQESERHGHYELTESGKGLLAGIQAE